MISIFVNFNIQKINIKEAIGLNCFSTTLSICFLAYCFYFIRPHDIATPLLAYPWED